MELNGEATGGGLRDAASTAVRLDATEPSGNVRDKTTVAAAAVALAAVTVGGHAAAERDERAAEVVDGDEDEDDKTAESVAAVAAAATTTTTTTAAAADEEPTGFVFPFGEPVPNRGSLMPPPGQRRTRPVVVRLCVNLHEMREARTVDADQTTAPAAAALTATTTTTTTATAPVEGASTSTTSAVAPIQRSRCSYKPIIIPFRRYDASDIPILSSGSDSTNWDLTMYENRLKTYRNNWVLSFLTPRQMAKAGFYFLGKHDAVRCVFCSKEFDYWLLGDDPYEKHKKESPGCLYLDQDLIYDICGNFESLPGHRVPGNEVNMIYHFLKTVGIVHQIRVLTHNKIFTSFESRYSTFHDNQITINSDIYTLCRTGYYSTGRNDETVCFCCNQGLKEWELHDDPWVEHARWSPTCSFVLLSKGKHFVEEVGGEVNYNLNVDMGELCKLVTIHKNTSVQNNNIASSLTERRLTYLNKTDHRIVKQMVPDFNQYIVQQHPNTLPDSMLCKICFKEKLEVLFMPCGHIISCIQCAVTIEQCAVCRLPFDISLRVYIYPTDKLVSFYNEEYHTDSFHEHVEAVPCKVCRKEDIELVFLPCRHACTCYSCGKEVDECPVCFEKVYAFIKVFL